MPRGAQSRRQHINRRTHHRPENEHDIRAAVYRRDGWTCQLCGEWVNPYAERQTPDAPTLDHIVPFERGGEFTVDNLQLAHFRCNSQRAARERSSRLDR